MASSSSQGAHHAHHHGFLATCWHRTKWVLGCGCIPNTIGGDNLDRAFAFYTPKMAVIQDRSLGILRIIFMCAIFAYIFIYKMWYSGIHFQVSEVEGLSRQEWQEPTMMWCNPRHLNCHSNYSNIQVLPYCRQYRGSDPDRIQRPCKYFDARELPITLSSGTLIPTYIQKFEQRKDCQDADEHCERKFHFIDELGLPQRGDGVAEPLRRDFVADVEDFTMTLDHSFRTTDGKVAYDDFLMDGHWSVCDKDLNRQDPNFHKEAALNPRKRSCITKPIKCIHWKCLNEEQAAWDKLHSKWNGKAASASLLDSASGGGAESAHSPRAGASGGARSPKSRWQALLEMNEGDQAEVEKKRPTPQELATAMLSGKNGTPVAMKGGDVFTLTHLLKMAGESLDETWDDDEEGPLNLRLRGTALMVNIHYTNVEKWTLFKAADPPWYTISVTSRPAHKFMHSYVSKEGIDSREMTWAYGVYVIVKQTGNIRTFDTITALLTLTSAMVLLSMSDLFVSMLAAYVMPKRAKYRALMYQVSDEMGDVDSDSEVTNEKTIHEDEGTKTA